ncbi:Homoserine dehydrogenase [Pseudobythopirellula maris]|uniref:Homoserine dehydrogenase n=1 Tax=Pseudobythopirellula maris TaxID=2527991 RepID=A0A5C5ZN57_9BACT|nr:homoserine dehydrogenase [Pseudobythopirellula maris]TWT88505.1 Homoserine dehydrogenase [Pseudobythopirellula maris]
MDKTKIGLIGLGTVGSGVAQLLLDHGDRTARHAGRVLWLEKVAVRDLNRPRDCELPAGVLTDQLDEVINHPEIEVVAELMGGVDLAREVVLRSLAAGKDVVTANKALLAAHGPELCDAARKHCRTIAFEASVAGGVPIITNLSQCLSANQVTSLTGILNGTCNFILAKMHSEGTPYGQALEEAQRLGYAEADPALDVNGADTAQKLAILAHLAFGARVAWEEIPCVGIDTLDVADIQHAQQMGYVIKLLGVAELTPDGVQLSVGPTLVRRGGAMADVSGPMNAVHVRADAVGELFYQGPGAGQMPTASAVVADLIDTAAGRTRVTFQTLELWSDRSSRVEMADPKMAVGGYYLRFMVDDTPGVLAKITGVLGEHAISISSVLQHEASDGSAPLVIMTHDTTEGEAVEACCDIAALDCVRSTPVGMRVRG